MKRTILFFLVFAITTHAAERRFRALTAAEIREHKPQFDALLKEGHENLYYLNALVVRPEQPKKAASLWGSMRSALNSSKNAIKKMALTVAEKNTKLADLSEDARHGALILWPRYYEDEDARERSYEHLCSAEGLAHINSLLQGISELPDLEKRFQFMHAQQRERANANTDFVHIPEELELANMQEFYHQKNDAGYIVPEEQYYNPATINTHIEAEIRLCSYFGDQEEAENEES